MHELPPKKWENYSVIQWVYKAKQGRFTRDIKGFTATYERNTGPLGATPVLLLSPRSQLITFTCCPRCKSIPSVTAAAPVTHLDGLSDELCGIIPRHQLSTWKTQQSGSRAACDLKLTPRRPSALCFTCLCRRCGGPRLRRHIWSTAGHTHMGECVPAAPEVRHKASWWFWVRATAAGYFFFFEDQSIVSYIKG